MVVLDNLVVTIALPEHPSRPRRLDPVARMDRQRLRARLRRAAADRRRARRSLRPQAHVHRRPRRSSPLASAAAALAPQHRPADRGARRAGHRRRDRHAADADPARRRLPAGAPRPRAGHLVAAISGIAVALGPLVGGAVIQIASWHWIFWINVPIGAVLCRSPRARLTESHGPAARSTCAASRSARPACSASSSASCARSRWAGRSVEVIVALAAGALLVRRLPGQELPDRGADAAARASSPAAASP